jgi:hypothetical protein
VTTGASQVIGLDDVLRHPESVAEDLVDSGLVYGLVDATVQLATCDMACFWLTLDPWKPMAAEEYPRERVAITMWRNGRIVAVPVDAACRPWLHRNLGADLRHGGGHRQTLFADAPAEVIQLAWDAEWCLGSPALFGDLCLWFPSDPKGLRWEWSDGLVSYITIVHRHLQAEEFWRRSGHWPAEDAPHGSGNHPVRTLTMHRASREGTANAG